MLISALALVGLGVYVLTFYLEFNFADVMPQMNVRQDSSLFGFYVYIALLALVLLGLDIGCARSISGNNSVTLHDN